jgi:hypothetical protein
MMMDSLLPEYEKNCLAEYSTDGQDKSVFVNAISLETFSRFKDAVKRLELEKLYRMVRLEQKELEAF